MKFFLNSILLCLINLKFILNEQQTKEIPLSPLEDLPGLKINSIKEIETLSNKSDMTFFLVMYRTDSDNSKRSVTLIKEVYNRLDNLVEFYVYDCTENLEKQSLCEKPAGTDAFPKMVVFVPPEFRVNPYTKQPNHHSQIVFTERQVNVLTIYNFITNNIVSHAKNLNSDNIEEFLNTDNINKVILFTDKEKTPLIYRAVSNVFFDRVLLGVVNKSERKLLKRFGISKMPVLLNYVTMDEDFIPYQDQMFEMYTDEIKPQKIFEFINRHALKEKRWITTNKGLPLVVRNNYKNATFNQFNSVAERYSSRRIVVHLSEEGVVSQEISKLFEQLSGFFVFINLKCEGQLLNCMNTFQLKNFDSLVLLPSGSNLTERLQNSTFLGKSLSDLLFDFVSLYKSELRESQNTTLSSFSYESRKNNKYPIFYFYSDEHINPAVYLIATEKKYTDKFDYISLKNPHEEIKKQLRINTIPKLLILMQNIGDPNPKNIQIMALQGDITYISLKKFSDTIIQNVINKKNDSEVDIDLTNDLNEDFAYINDTRAFRQECNGRMNPSSIKQFDSNVNELDKVMLDKKSTQFSFMWVNATCQTNLAMKFNIQPDFLPSAILYVPRKGFYSTMIGTYEASNIKKFMDDFIHGKISQYSVSLSDKDFLRIVCENIKEEKIENEEDPILKEIIEEEKKKREQFERERQEAMKKKKKSRKPKTPNDEL